MRIRNRCIRSQVKRRFPILVLPLLVCFVMCFVVPFIQALRLSFCDFFIPKDAVWTGLDNYKNAVLDTSFWHSFLITFMFALVAIVVINVPAYFLAYLLKDKFKGATLIRTSFFIPNLIGGVVLGYIWSMIFDGVLQMFDTYLTSSAVYGFWGLVILVAWQQIGYMMIIYIAGFTAVPGEMVEAAEMDGAGRFRKLFNIVTPNMKSSIAVCVFLTLTNSFKMFDQNLALTAGGPVETLESGMQIKTTEFLALNIYSTYQINRNWHGIAQAKAVIFFVLVAAMVSLQFFLTREKKEVRK